MAADKVTREDFIETALRGLALGSLSLPAALGMMWDAGREAERLDNLRMQQAEREGRRLARASRGTR